MIVYGAQSLGEPPPPHVSTTRHGLLRSEWSAAIKSWRQCFRAFAKSHETPLLLKAAKNHQERITNKKRMHRKINKKHTSKRTQSDVGTYHPGTKRSLHETTRLQTTCSVNFAAFRRDSELYIAYHFYNHGQPTCFVNRIFAKPRSLQAKQGYTRRYG